MDDGACRSYQTALNQDIARLVLIVWRIDEILRDSQSVLDACQPAATGKIGIVWEERDIGAGKALTPRIAEYKRLKSGAMRYKRVTEKYLSLRAKNKGEFMHNMSITRDVLEQVTKLFEARHRVIECIRVIRIKSTLTARNNLGPLNKIEDTVRQLAELARCQNRLVKAPG